MSITTEQYRQMLARTEGNKLRSPAPDDAVEMESTLRDDLESLCRSRGWCYIRARTDKRSTIAVGWPDFSIFMDHGRSVFLELKRKGGKATTEQLATIAHLKHLGHTAEVVQSMTEACQVIARVRKQITEHVWLCAHCEESHAEKVESYFRDGRWFCGKYCADLYDASH